MRGKQNVAATLTKIENMERTFGNHRQIVKGSGSVEKRLFSAFKWVPTEQAHASLNLYTPPLMETCTRAADVFVSVDSVKTGKLTCYLGAIRL